MSSPIIFFYQIIPLLIIVNMKKGNKNDKLTYVGERDNKNEKPQ